MKTISKILEIIENRVRNIVRMKSASKNIDQIRQKAPADWNSAQIIRQMREARR